MSDETKEIVQMSANLIFLSAVIVILLLFFNLRSEYGGILLEQAVAEDRASDVSRYGMYNSALLTGYDVVTAISAYSDRTPVYVSGAYNHVTAATAHTGRVYSQETKLTNPAWFKILADADPMTDSAGMQALYRYDTRYYALLTYDSDNPEALIRDMALSASADASLRNCSLPSARMGTSVPAASAADGETVTARRSGWAARVYNAARPRASQGQMVSGIVFICVGRGSVPASAYNSFGVTGG